MKTFRVALCSLLLISSFSCVTKYQGNTNIVQNSNVIPSTSSSLNPSLAPVTSTITGSLKVETSPNAYTPTMSSTVGILINPIIDNINEYKVTFQTTNGYFLSWNSQVKNLGKDITYDNNKTYWSFSGTEKFKEDNIKISVFNKSDNKLIDSLNLKVVIDDKGMATIVK